MWADAAGDASLIPEMWPSFREARNPHPTLIGRLGKGLAGNERARPLLAGTTMEDWQTDG